MKRYRAAVAGAGFMGGTHVDALRRLRNVDVVAMAGMPGEQDLMEALGIPGLYFDPKEMLDREKVDVVHICTPNSTHREIAEYAMERGIHVICEKPLSTGSEDARAMLRCAQRNGVMHGVNYHNRFYPMVNELREQVAAGTLGKLVSVHGSYLQDWLLKRENYSWRLRSSQSGKTRVVADIGTHWTDAVSYITGGRVKEVFADLATHYPVRLKDGEEMHIDTEDFAHILLRYDNGMRGSMTVSQMFAGRKNSLSIHLAGEERSGMWELELPEILSMGAQGEPLVLLRKGEGPLAESTARLAAYPAGHPEGFPDAVRQMFASFYASLADPGAPRPYATFADGLAAVTLCDAVFESAGKGRWVAVPLEA